MLWPRSLGRRIDQIRSGVEQGPSSPSTSTGDALARLERALDRHLAHHDAESAATSRLTRALDLIPQGIVLADAEGRIVFRNPAASGFVDARHGEALVEGAIEELVDSAVEGGTETRTVDLFGPPRRAIELRAGPLRAEAGADADDEAHVVGAFVIVDDVSERQRLDAVRRDFVANISHELKTPVGALGVLAETIAAEDDPAVLGRLADRMQHEAFRVARTIDDLLQLSQIEADVLGSPGPEKVRDIVEGAVERTRTAAEMAEVSVVADPVDESEVLDGDRAQLVSALSNLCENAIKYSDRGQVVRVSAVREGSWMAFTVTDSGVGIPARDLQRIFERFYRVDRARSRDTGGTGLGLSIVRHVVQNHGGEITVRSREGEGSTFTFRIPLEPAESAERGGTPHPNPSIDAEPVPSRPADLPS